MLYGPDDIYELHKINRFGDIAVRLEPVCLHHVPVVPGSRQYHDRNGAQVGIGFQFRQHLPAVLARQIQVQQDQVGPRGAGVRIPPVQEFHRLDAVFHMAEIARNPPRLQGFDGEVRIARTVLDEENLDGSVRRHGGRQGTLQLAGPGTDEFPSLPGCV